MLDGRLQDSEATHARPERAATPDRRPPSGAMSIWLNDQRVIGTLFVLPALAILAFVVVLSLPHRDLDELSGQDGRRAG